jgi:hypothetical protein
MKTSNIMKTFASLCLILLCGAGVAFAQNLTVNGTLTVDQNAFLEGASTSINGNVNLGSSSTNIINFYGAAGTGLFMANQGITHAQSISLGWPYETAPYTATSGVITLYSSSNTNYATIFAAAQTSDYTYQIPNAGASASFVMTQGAQTINANLGGKTFSSTSNSSAPLTVSNTSGGGTNPALSVPSGAVNIAGLTASSPVFTDANDNLTNTGTIPYGDLPIATASSLGLGVVYVDGSTITVSPSGEITAIGAAPSGAASGDLANMYPDPTIAANQSASTDIAASLNTNAPAAPINPAAGGTGLTSLTAYEVVTANATGSAMTQVSGVGSTNEVLTSNGSGAAPTWQPSGATITNTTSTASVSSDQNPFAPNATATYIRISNTSAGTINVNSINLTGVADGRMLTITNVSQFSYEYIMINSQMGPAPSSEQFNLPMQQPIILGQQGSATFIYDITSGYWELLSTN